MPDPGEPKYYVAESAARLVSDVPDSTLPDWVSRDRSVSNEAVTAVRSRAAPAPRTSRPVSSREGAGAKPTGAAHRERPEVGGLPHGRTPGHQIRAVSQILCCGDSHDATAQPDVFKLPQHKTDRNICPDMLHATYLFDWQVRRRGDIHTALQKLCWCAPRLKKDWRHEDRTGRNILLCSVDIYF